MMNVNSVYTGLVNLAGRKTATGLNLFNGLVEAGLVHFLSAKEEKEAKTVTVNLKELAEARAQAEKVLSTARATKAYRGVATAKKAVKAAKRIFAGLSRKVKSLAVMSIDSLKAAESKAKAAYTALRAARNELQNTINHLAQAKGGDSVRAIYSALKACRLAAFRVEQLSVEHAFAQEQLAVVAARQAA